MISVSWEAKVELVLLVLVIISYLAFLIGTFMPVTESRQNHGITGYKWDTIRANLWPDWRDQTFVTVFGVYFPS